MATKDEVVDFQAQQQWYENLQADKHLITMEDASHFFHGQLINLKQRLIDLWPAL